VVLFVLYSLSLKSLLLTAENAEDAERITLISTAFLRDLGVLCGEFASPEILRISDSKSIVTSRGKAKAAPDPDTPFRILVMGD
jgi:hypothetical protein